MLAGAGYRRRNRQSVIDCESTGSDQLRNRLLGRPPSAGQWLRAGLPFEEALVVGEHRLEHLHVVLLLSVRHREQQPEAARIGPLGFDSPPGAEKAEGGRRAD